MYPPFNSDIIEFECLKSLKNEEKEKIERIKSLFFERYQYEADIVIVAPGRVNIIGDHIDYHGFSVLPMAIDKSVIIACSIQKNDDKGRLRLHNSHKEYPSYDGIYHISEGGSFEKSHRWENYVLCGHHGVLVEKLLNIKPERIYDHANQPSGSEDKLYQELDHYQNQYASLGAFNILVDSNLPEASGLSSSSALVCGSAVASSIYLHHCTQAENESIESPSIRKSEVASSCAFYEHLIGTRGGGMDQAVICTANEGYAKHVQFKPEFRCDDVQLPENAIWYVAHCGVHYAKAATSGFNSRVFETKLAASMIVKYHNSPLEINNTITLKQVKDAVFGRTSVEQITKEIQFEIFKNRNDFSLEEVCKVLNLTQEEISMRFKVTEEFIKQISKSKLKLLDRCLHVFEEAERVAKFKTVCDTTRDIKMLGQLMTESHVSLRDKYDCSVVELDDLIDTALSAGALGARLTGAGWGGCIVVLVDAMKSDIVRGALEKVSKFVFQTEPKQGISVFRI